MNRTLYIHQLDQLHATLGSGADILPKIRAQGFTRIALKLFDGMDWMGDFDADHYHLTDWNSLLVWQAAANAATLALDVWCNVTDPAWQSALSFYEYYLANFPGRLILDLEPYGGFFGDIDPSPFLSALRSLLVGPTANAYFIPRVSLCYDPRRVDWLSGWLNQFGTHLPQVYGEDQITPAMVPVVGRPVEPLLSVGDQAANWVAILRDPVLGNEDGRTGFGVFRAPLVRSDQIIVVQDMG